jgi:isoquinoline 1-oxidoreductase beta subunit
MPRERWRHMGRDVARLDIPGKTDGSAVYGIDVKVPGMMHAAILQCPHFGGTLSGVDERPALAMRGVKKVVRLADAVAVVADSYWRAQKAVNALKPQWNLVRASSHTSAAYMESLRKAVQADGALVVPRTSTIDKVLASYSDAAAKGKEVIDRSYAVPLLSHAPMEPMNGTAHFKGGKVTLWLPTQAQDTARTLVAKALNIAPEAVTVHTTLSGGGFGRRIEADFAIQAALISREAGVPVKLLWSREQDMKHGFYRPAAVLRLRASVAADGAMTALRIDSAADTLFNYSRFGADRQYAEPFDRSAYGHPLSDYYSFGAQQFRVNTVDAGVPLGYWRSVAASQNVFAYESLVDELAQLARVDPLEYRRRMTKEGGRDRRVIEAMAAHPSWAVKPAAGRFRGAAYAKANGSHVGEIVELSVDAGKRVKLHKVTVVIDCGTAVNPRNIRAQLEGGVIFALSAAFYGAITIKDGAVEQSNFHDYRLASLAETPQFEVVILDSSEAAGGVGEESVGPFAPALANALAAATGQRSKELPLAKAGFTLA